jgi:hypothetical protein
LDGFVSFAGFWVVVREFLKKYFRGTHGCGGWLVEGLASSMLPGTEAPTGAGLKADDITSVNFVREGTAMTMKAALAFIDRVRRDERLRDKIALLGRDPSLEALVRLGEVSPAGSCARRIVTTGPSVGLPALQRTARHQQRIARPARRRALNSCGHAGENSGERFRPRAPSPFSKITQPGPTPMTIALNIRRSSHPPFDRGKGEIGFSRGNFVADDVEFHMVHEPPEI